MTPATSCYSNSSDTDDDDLAVKSAESTGPTNIHHPDASDADDDNLQLAVKSASLLIKQSLFDCI